MNLILLRPEEVGRPLPADDRRTVHVRQVLRRRPGETFQVGILNGDRGTASIVRDDVAGLHLDFRWSGQPAEALDEIVLIVGLPRPQTARDVLRDASTMGVAAIHFVQTSKTESSYAQSTLWTTGEWERHVCLGAEQAARTTIPAVTFDQALASALTRAPGAARIALDNYEGVAPFSKSSGIERRPITVAIGPERGWSAEDRDGLRSAGYVLAHLGPAPLRTETAVTAALAVLKASRGIF